jgi:hypothetical protein
MRRPHALLAAVILAAALPASAGPAPAKRKPAPGAHPAVPTEAACRDCHEQATPTSYLTWADGKHGLDLVTCNVCHGSTGADFKRRPGPDRCQGCHPEQAESLAAPHMKGKDCFSCHPAHLLDPHVTSQPGSPAGRLGADEELKRERTLAGPVNGPNPAAEAAAKPPPGAAAPTPGTAAPAAPPAAREKDLGAAQPHPPQEHREPGPAAPPASK